ELVLVAGLVHPRGGEVVAGADLLAQRHRGALGTVDDVVLDDPALGPVRPDQPRLVRRGWSPGCGRVGQLEPANGHVVHVVVDRVEDRPTYVDLDQGLAGVHAGEPRQQDRLRVVHLGVPHQVFRWRPAGLRDAGPVVDHGGRWPGP